MKINLYLIICLILLSQAIYCQPTDMAVINMKEAINNFFIAKGEITKDNNLSAEAYEITDKSDISIKSKGIYIIRTVYRTDGNDYLLFKNNNDFIITDFTDLKIIIDRMLTLFRDENDDMIFIYLKALTECYDDYLYIKNKRNIKFIKTKP